MIACVLLGLCGLAAPAAAQDPISAIAGRAIGTALDVRTKDEVQNDIAIDTSLTKKILDAKGDELKDVSTLVFAQHLVLAGSVKNAAGKQVAEKLAASDKRIRSIKNDLMIKGDTGSTVSNLVINKKIDLTLTATKGVSSVNMRWKVLGSRVVLMGVAKSPAEASLAVSKIKSIDGVKTVASYLRIAGK
jgi:hyperosmotically inducible protein